MKNRQHIFLFFVFILFSIFIGIIRLHTYHEPLERDLALYAVIGHELNQGRELYSDLWDHKPPAIYATFALADRIVGYGPQQIYFLNWGAAVLTMLGLFLLVNSITGNRTVCLWAVVFWLVISGDLHLQANQPNSEVFINVCMVWGIALFLSSRNRCLWILTGILFALASLFKQIIVVPILAMLGTALLWPLMDRKTVVAKTLIIGISGIVVWGSVMGYFALTDRWDAFYEAVFEYNHVYAGNLFDNIVKGLKPGHVVPGYLAAIALPFELLVIVGFVLSLYNKISGRHWLFWIAWSVGTWVAVSLPGRFYPHYYQFWLPVIVVGGSLGLWCIALVGRPWLVHGAGIIVLLLLLFHEVPFYQMPAKDWSKEKYGNVFATSEKLGKELNQLLRPNETFYELGEEAGLYFYSQRSPLTGFLFYYHLIQKPFGLKFSQRVVTDLDKAPPDLFIIKKSVDSILGTNHPIIQWFTTRYSPAHLSHVKGPFNFFVRKGSELEKRLQ